MSDEVKITNHRADATQNESLIGMARMGADAFGYTAQLRIDRGLAQLLRLRVSQLNNCSYCLNLHHQAARDAGIPRAKIDTLTAWWETDLYSEAEQAALRYAEALTRAPSNDGTTGRHAPNFAPNFRTVIARTEVAISRTPVANRGWRGRGMGP